MKKEIFFNLFADKDLKKQLMFASRTAKLLKQSYDSCYTDVEIDLIGFILIKFKF